MVFFHPQMLLLLWLLPMICIIWFLRRKRLRWSVLIIRLLVVSLIILALANPTIEEHHHSPNPSLVVLVDQSDSLTPSGQAELRARAMRLVQAWEARESASEGSKGKNDRLVPKRQALVLWFGRTISNPAHPADHIPKVSHRTTSLDPSATNLAGALRGGRELIAASGGRMVLLSDGIPTATEPDMPATHAVVHEAAQAAAVGIPIDVWPIAPLRGPELRITYLETDPKVVRVGDNYRIQVAVEYASPSLSPATPPTTTVLLRLWETPPDGGERLFREEPISLQAGNPFSGEFSATATSRGIVLFRAALAGFAETVDTFAQNNQAYATTTVVEPPRILLVEGQEGLASKLESALWGTSVESVVAAPHALPTRLSDLQGYDGIVLLNVASHQLSYPQMSTIQEFVKSEGRGVVIAGGPDSYSLGGYQGTPLEFLLPVRLDPPPRPQRPTVALLLIIDRSASMSVPLDVSKFDMAREAAMLSTEMLQADDRIGVLVFDTGQDWIVPFQQVGYGLSLKQIQDAIAMVGLGGGTDIHGAIREGLPALAAQPASVRHAVLLTDGRSFSNDRYAYHRIVSMAREQDITLSTIAIGRDSDTELLNQLAQWGRGRYYFTESPSDIPRITIQESAIARSAPMVESDFQALADTPHAILSGFDPTNFPLLHGYVATTRRPGAETVLRTPDVDPEHASPILSTWQYGLGRVIAWTSSATEPWGSSWMEWDQYAAFWDRLIRYTLAPPERGPIQVAMDPTPNGVRLTVEASKPGDRPLNFAQVEATITLPNRQTQTVSLPQTGPGRYAEHLLLPVEGVYGIDVELVTNDTGEIYQARTSYIHPIPEEYQAAWMFSRSQPDLETQALESGEGLPLLERIAMMTGGTIIRDETALAHYTHFPTADQGPRPHGLLDPIRHALWFWLILTAVVLWLLEVSLQRRA